MLTQRTSRRLLVLTNAAAGTASAEAVDAAVTVLREAATVRVEPTESPAELDQVLAAREPGEQLVVAGGDGSVHAAVAALERLDRLEPDDPVGLLPLGTGNDLARCLGIPLDPAEAARTVLGGRPRVLDLLVDDDGNPVVNVVHAGIGAEAARDAETWKQRIGPAGYAVGAASAGLRSPGWTLQVEVDGRVVSSGKAVLMVAVGSGTTIGGGTPLLPDAVPDDGLADVVLVHAVGPLARILYALDLRDGEHVRRDDVTVLRGRVVRVSGADGFPTNADGEVSGPWTERTWTVRPAAWALVVPPGPPDVPSVG